MPGMLHGEAADRLKKLRFRSWHRGTRELDLILGPFADTVLESLDEAELAEYERLLNLNDSDLMDWVLGIAPPPPDVDSPLFRRILRFRNTP